MINSNMTPDRGGEFGTALKALGKRAVGTTALLLDALLGSRAGHSLGILAYHRITPPVAGIPTPTLNVTPQRLHRQLVGLKAKGYRFWSLREVLAKRIAKVDLPPRSVVVTFDDGYANNESVARPILEDLGIPATIFVSTAYLDSNEPMPFDAWGRRFQDRVAPEAYRPLTTEECLRLCRSGLIDIGSHTHTHRDFRGRPQEFEADLLTSLDLLKDRLQRRNLAFAFPFGRRHTGHSADDLVEITRKARVSCALTTEAELVDLHGDPFGWGRFNVYDWDTAGTLAARLNGWYGWAPALQNRLHVAYAKDLR